MQVSKPQGSTLQVITAEHAFAQGTRPWVIRSAANFNDRVARREDSPRHRRAAFELRQVAKDLTLLWRAANGNSSRKRRAA